MKVYHGLDSPELRLPHCALTIGNFDGVHRGHQQIIAQAGLFAANTGGPTAVVTFEPHPLTVVAPDRAPPRLTPQDEKLDCLAAAGADVTVVCLADRALLSLTAEAFVARLVERLHPTHIVEGASFGFGRGRSGNPDTLRSLGEQHGFEVFIVDPVRLQLDGGTTLEVSSSMIRKLIAEGRVHRAALCLGRPYALLGRVASGRGRGASLGYPTANLEVSEQLVPQDGVYSGFARLIDEGAGQGRDWPAAVSIGTAPTFENEPERKIEAFLLDADLDLYGRRMRLAFGQWLRGQEKFDSVEALSAQIARDVEAVRRYAARRAAISEDQPADSDT